MVKNITQFVHDLPDGMGNDVPTKCVQFTIVGNNSSWDDWGLLVDFKKLNPKIKI